jgi:hypothetical protein
MHTEEFRVTSADGLWREVGERVFTRRYRFLHQQIGVVLTDDGPVGTVSPRRGDRGARTGRRQLRGELD